MHTPPRLLFSFLSPSPLFGPPSLSALLSLLGPLCLSPTFSSWASLSALLFLDNFFLHLYIFLPAPLHSLKIPKLSFTLLDVSEIVVS